jgi:CDP-diacylglycerol--serine O-phosphatidyltransferase
MFAGFYAILAAANGRFEAACIAIIIAGLFDGVDGRVARMTGTTSAFGVQYDSLSDLISFGMAPALVMYHWSLSALRLDSNTWGKVGWSIAFLYVACAALRLARFNVSAGSADKRFFIGLASPASAGMMVGFIWFFVDTGVDGGALRHVALVVTAACALLMVSGVRYPSFKGGAKKEGEHERVPFWVLLGVVLLLGAIMVDPPKVIFALGVLFVLGGPLLAWWMRRAG